MIHWLIDSFIQSFIHSFIWWLSALMWQQRRRSVRWPYDADDKTKVVELFVANDHSQVIICITLSIVIAFLTSGVTMTYRCRCLANSFRYHQPSACPSPVHEACVAGPGLFGHKKSMESNLKVGSGGQLFLRGWPHNSATTFQASTTTVGHAYLFPDCTGSLWWLSGWVVSVPDSGSEEHGFESQSRRCRVAVLGKLFALIVPRSTQPCIYSGSLNRVPASAGVKAGKSSLPGGR